MAKINNSAVIQKLIDELELYPAKDLIPSEIADKILPTFQVNSQDIIVQNPTANVVKEAQQTGGTGGTALTIYTTPATGKFYLTGVWLSAQNEDTSHGDQWISVFIDSVEVKVCYLRLRYTATHHTKEPQHGFLSFTNPILIDPATAIAMKRTTDNGTHSTAIIYGYTEE